MRAGIGRLVVPVADDAANEGLAAAVAAAGRVIGLEVLRPDDPARTPKLGIDDAVIAAGFPAALRPHLAAACQAGLRVAWFGEPMPRVRPGMPVPAAPGLVARLPVGPLGRLPLPAALGDARTAALVERNRWHNLRDALSLVPVAGRLVPTSGDREAVLRAHGAPSVRRVPFGYHPLVAGPLWEREDRDIDVLVLASRTGRGADTRMRRTAAVLRALPARYRRQVVEGVWGAERDALLCRARVILDVHRAPGNFAGLRYLLAGAAGAVHAGDPTDAPEPFVPGEHVLEADLAGLPAALCALLDDERARRRMVSAMRTLLEGELRMERMVEAVLAP